MFTKPIEEAVSYLVQEAKRFGAGCTKVYVSLSGGVDSAVVALILTETYGAENVVASYRDVRSNPVHKADAAALAQAFGFSLLCFDFNPIYDAFLAECKKKFLTKDLPWIEEGETLDGKNWINTYSSLKSRMMTPFAGFISKAIDGGSGRIFGTGNLEEDYLLRYFDKFGDGAVDNNILVGLTKMEVRQIALWFGEKYEAPICQKIAEKLPSADLQSNGNAHNDESELTMLARSQGFDISLSYGTSAQEGNLAWICKQDLDLGIVRGRRSRWVKALATRLDYTQEQIALTLFMRRMEKSTRHKALNIPGVTRQQLRLAQLVD